MEKHQDTPIEQLESNASGSTISGTSSSTTTNTNPSADVEDKKDNPEDDEPGVGQAKSYKCNDCGKHLRSWQAVQFHAERT